MGGPAAVRPALCGAAPGTRGTLHLPAEEPVTDTMLEDSRELPAFLEVLRAKLNRRVPEITEAHFPILKGGTVLCEIHRTIWRGFPSLEKAMPALSSHDFS